MTWWYYSGQVTTPVNIPGKGPTVIKPRTKFQAPKAAVMHLINMGKVSPAQPPKAEKKADAPKSPGSAPESKKVEGGAALAATVVASTQPEKVATVQEIKATEEKSQEKEKAAQEEEKSRRSSRKKS